MPNYAPFAPFMTILRSMNVCSMTVKSVSRRWQERGADNRPTSDKSTAASDNSRQTRALSLSLNSLIDSFNWQNEIAMGEFRPEQ